jgi:hypothetical protein
MNIIGDESFHHKYESKKESHSSQAQSHLNDFLNSFHSQTSSNSHYRGKNLFKEKFFKYIYTSITIINLIFALIGLYYRGKFLSNYVYIYIISYSFLWPICFLISLNLTAFIKFFVFLTTKNIETSKNLIENEFKANENTDNQMDHTLIKSEQNSQTFYTLFVTIFIIILLIFYLISIPASIFAMNSLLMTKNFKSEYLKFIFVFLFIIINLIKSLFIFILSVYYFLLEKFYSNKMKINFDEEFIQNIEKEIEQANKFSGVIGPSKDLIKLNYMFNRQYNTYKKKFESKVDDRNIFFTPNKDEVILSINENKNTIDLEANDKKKNKYKEKKNIIKSLIRRKTMNYNYSEKIIEKFKSNIGFTNENSFNYEKRHTLKNFEINSLNIMKLDENQDNNLIKSVGYSSGSKDDINFHIGNWSSNSKSKMFELEKESNSNDHSKNKSLRKNSIDISQIVV